MYSPSRSLVKDMSQEYDLLAEKMKNNLPIQAYPSRELVLKFRAQFPKLNIKSELMIVETTNMGNVCGIWVKVKHEDSTIFFNCSLTNLLIEYSEPLRKDIQVYQFERMQRSDS